MLYNVWNETSIEPENVEILRPGLIEVPKLTKIPTIFLALRLDFTVPG